MTEKIKLILNILVSFGMGLSASQSLVHGLGLLGLGIVCIGVAVFILVNMTEKGWRLKLGYGEEMFAS